MTFHRISHLSEETCIYHVLYCTVCIITDILDKVIGFNEISSNSIANFYIALLYGHKIISSYNYVYKFFKPLSSISLHSCNKCIIAGAIVLT